MEDMIRVLRLGAHPYPYSRTPSRQRKHRRIDRFIIRLLHIPKYAHTTIVAHALRIALDQQLKPSQSQLITVSVSYLDERSYGAIAGHLSDVRLLG